MIGQTLGHYRIEALLGSGGMGVVYRAFDTRLRRPVAIKLLNSSPDEAGRARLLGEARAASALNHPNICTIHEVAETSDHAWIVMEYVEGTPLKGIIPAGGFSPETFQRYALQLSDALGHAHRGGIIHRDIKSANVLITAEGRLKVLDFGLAHRLPQPGDDHTHSFALASPGTLAGTLAYMAPEVLNGAQVDRRSDVWSLGVLFYEMASGSTPFNDLKGLPLAAAITGTQPIPPLRSNLTAPQRSVIQRCLERDPIERFEDAGAVHAALDRLDTPARVSWQAVAALALVVMAIALVFAYQQRSAPPPAAGTEPSTQEPPVVPRRAVAVLGFRNVSGRPAAAWMSTALAEMLTTELAAGEQLRTIPGENIARMKSDLALTDADSFAADTLARIRANLGSDVVVVGSYVAVGDQIRFDVRLQDTVAGQTIAAVAETGSEDNLLEVVSTIGARLRDRLGVAELTPAQIESVHASLPSSPGAARLYAEGLARLRLFDAQGARTALDRAVAADPNRPLAYSALALAWSQLGYDERAQEAARHASDLSAKLSREDRLWVEGRYYETTNDQAKAVETYRTLYRFFPDNLDYGLQLVAAQTAAGTGMEALATVEALRRLPAPARDDARIDLAEAQAASSLSDFRQHQAAAARAAAKGQAQGARLLVARARLSESAAWQDLGEPEKAIAAADEARQIYAAAGDRGGEGRAIRTVAVTLRARGDLAGATAMYRQALTTFREIGDRRGTALTLNNIANVYRQQLSLGEARLAYSEALALFREIGDRSNIANVLNNTAILLRLQGNLAEAKRSYAEALAIRRAIGEKAGVAATLNNLANVLADEGDIEGALRLYDETVTIGTEIGDRAGVARAQFNIGEMLRFQGDLAGAGARYDEALDARRSLGDRSGVAGTLRGIGIVQTARGDFAGARKTLSEAQTIHESIGEKGAAARTRLALAALALDEGHAADAEGLARQAVDQFREERAADDEGMARAVLARALVASDKAREAEAAIRPALRPAADSRNRQVRFAVGVAQARVDIASRRWAAAAQRLRTLLPETAGMIEHEFAVRLALGEAEIASGQATAGRARLDALEKDATARGFLVLARQAALARR